MATKKQLQLRLKEHLEGTDAQIEAFLLRVEKLLTTEMRKRLKQLKSGKVTPQLLTRTLGNLITTLNEAGLGDQIEELRKIYRREERFIDTQLGIQDLDAELTGTDKKVVETLIDFDVSSVSKKIEGYVEDARSTLARAVYLGQDPDFDAVTEKLEGRLAGNLKSELTTLTMGFSRAVTARKAEEIGIEEFIYLGPLDKVTRPFCNDVLSRSPAIYTLQEIKGLDNDQGLDVLTYGGGYNCRHSWQPVSSDLAKELRGESD